MRSMLFIFYLVVPFGPLDARRGLGPRPSVVPLHLFGGLLDDGNSRSELLASSSGLAFQSS